MFDILAWPFTAQMTRQAPRLRVTQIQALQRANLPLVLLASFLPSHPFLVFDIHAWPFTAQMTRQAPRLRVTPIQALQRANLPLVLLASFLPFHPFLVFDIHAWPDKRCHSQQIRFIPRDPRLLCVGWQMGES